MATAIPPIDVFINQNHAASPSVSPLDGPSPNSSLHESALQNASVSDEEPENTESGDINHQRAITQSRSELLAPLDPNQGPRTTDIDTWSSGSEITEQSQQAGPDSTPSPSSLSLYPTTPQPDQYSGLPPFIWLPYSLRWQVLLMVFAFACIVEVMVVTLHITSVRNSGLVDDDGSRGIIVASKFVPTLLASPYVFVLSIILDDIKRTEVFARLAASSGAFGKTSLTWTAGAWWNALARSFPRGGARTRWAMLWSTLAYVLGFLVISPFSASLLVSQEVQFSQDTQFDQFDLPSCLPLKANPVSTTYFKTLSNLFQGVPTSAWITDKFIVLPFWPAEYRTSPVGPVLSGNAQVWTAITTVFQSELDCDQMYITANKSVQMHNGLLGSMPGFSMNLSSPTGCSVGLNMNEDSTPGTNGMAIWSTADDMDVSTTNTNRDWLGGNITVDGCSGESLLLISDNSTVLGLSCRVSYYAGDVTATMTLENNNSLVTIDENNYQTVRKALSPDVANTSSFQTAFHSTNWTIHLDAETISRGSDATVGPLIYRTANPLYALYDFSLEQMMKEINTSLISSLANLQHRFFAEMLLDDFQSCSTSDISATINTSRRRVVTSAAVAIILEVALGLQIVLLAAVFGLTRLSRRPLQLYSDPTPVAALTKLISHDQELLELLRNLQSASSKSLQDQLAELQFESRGGTIHLIAPRNSDSALPKTKSKNDVQQKSKGRIFGLWVLALLLLLLLAVLVTIAALYQYSRARGFYQTAFVYSIHTKFQESTGGGINIASILTTLLAVGVGLWWGSLDTTLRKAQPFLELARAEHPAPGWKGVSVSYISSYLLWAAWRAAKRGHWVLGILCTGTFLSQICECIFVN